MTARLTRQQLECAGEGYDPVIDEVLQPEDIGLVESVQRGMRTPGLPAWPLPGGPGRIGNRFAR